MKKTVLATVAVALLSTTAVYAADMPVKAPPAPVVVAPPSPWDIAMGAGVYSNYIFRGISQSNDRASVNAYFEPRYNVSDNLQLYAGVAGWSIAFANRASAEIDLYAGFRPVFGKLAFDFGVWYYYYPGGQCFNAVFTDATLTQNFGADCVRNGSLPINGNVIKKDLSFVEYYGKVNWAPIDTFSIGGALYYDPDWLNFGTSGTFASGNVKFSAPGAWMPKGAGAYLSAEVGRYWFGTTDQFYCTAGGAFCGSGNAATGFPLATNFPNGVPLPDYTAWNVGVGLTWNVFTVDVRYYDTDLSKGDCNVLTSDFNATFNQSNVSNINPNGFGSNWCGEKYVISLKGDLTYVTNLIK